MTLPNPASTAPSETAKTAVVSDSVLVVMSESQFSPSAFTKKLNYSIIVPSSRSIEWKSGSVKMSHVVKAPARSLARRATSTMCRSTICFMGPLCEALFHAGASLASGTEETFLERIHHRYRPRHPREKHRCAHRHRSTFFGKRIYQSHRRSGCFACAQRQIFARRSPPHGRNRHRAHACGSFHRRLFGKAIVWGHDNVLKAIEIKG